MLVLGELRGGEFPSERFIEPIDYRSKVTRKSRENFVMTTVFRVFSYLKRYPGLATAQLACAIVATLLYSNVVDYTIVIAGIVVGSVIGVVAAQRIAMTAMPQMVALLNGFGGAASVLVASAEVIARMHAGDAPTGIVPGAIVASVLIGGVTLTGSLIAFAKLQEVMTGAPIQYPLQQYINAAIAIGTDISAYAYQSGHCSSIVTEP